MTRPGAGSERRSILPLSGVWVTTLLIALMLFLPLPYGSVTPNALLGYRLSAALAVILVAGSRSGHLADLRRIVVPLCALGGLAVLGVVQSLPVPQDLVLRLSPAHHAIVAAVRDAEWAGREGGGADWCLSLAPEASRSVALSALAAGGLLAAGFVAGRRSRRRRWLAAAVLLAAAFQVLYGLRPWLEGDLPRLRGTWVNPDHLALQLEIALCVGLGVIWGIGRRLRAAARQELPLMLLAVTALVWLLILAGLVVTGSRAGLAAGLAGIGVTAMLLSTRSSRRGLALSAFALAVAGGTLFIATIGRGALGRLLSTSAYDVVARDRAHVWREALALVAEYPWLGTGLGSFEESYPLVQAAAPLRGLWGRAHNDYLELLVCGGVVGLALGLAGLAGMVRALVMCGRRGVRSEDRLAAYSGLGALSAVACHEVFDFGASLPANSATLAVVLGAAAAARLTSRAAGRLQPVESSVSRAAVPPAD